MAISSPIAVPLPTFTAATPTPPLLPRPAALALKLGCNINCGATYSAVLDAVKQGLVDEETIDKNLIRAYTTRVLLGEFEDKNPTRTSRLKSSTATSTEP